MRMKTKRLITRILSGALVMLGFTACDDDSEYPPCEYGTPWAAYRVKGNVTDANGNPLENIRVILRRGRNDNPVASVNDTVNTDKEGNYVFEHQDFPGTDMQKVIFDDIDGEAGGGKFKSDSTSLDDMQPVQIEKGDNKWYNGKFEYTANKQLEKESGE